MDQQHLDSATNFLPSHDNQPSIPPMVSGALEGDGDISGEALEELSWAQIGNAMSYYPGDLSVATTDAPNAMDPYFMFNHNGDCIDSSVNDAFVQGLYHDLRDTITEYGAMQFSPAEPPMQCSETNVSAVSTAWPELKPEFNLLDIDAWKHPETEIANVSNLELGDLPSDLEAASLTRHASKGKKGSRRLCPHCTASPQGFRGNYELNRHQTIKHQAHVTFVCRDPTEAGLVSKLSATQPLSKCSVCARGKIYDRRENAAAHLRNGHFKNKPSRSPDSLKDPRGGKRDGNQDRMISLDDLRPWIVEVGF
ncbi:hypothetical protein E4U58_007502 [Claviceps cyperi]|nr:hypothetical protein E4U58_007502 [Claviceps cyperi]